MERESDKHSPRIDDAMAHDVESLLKGAPVESRANEERLQEDPDVGPGRRFEELDDPGLGINEADADRRAELSRHLAGVHFPAHRDDLVAVAEAGQAPDDVLITLRGLPADRAFETVQEVWQAAGGRVEDAHTRQEEPPPA